MSSQLFGSHTLSGAYFTGIKSFFDAQALNQLFATEPNIDFKGQLFYKSTNETGFTLQMKLEPDFHKCSFKLRYEKYQDPVFEVPFVGVESIEVDLTPCKSIFKTTRPAKRRTNQNLI